MTPVMLRELVFDMLIRPSIGPPLSEQWRARHTRRVEANRWRVSYPRVWRADEVWLGVVPRETVSGLSHGYPRGEGTMSPTFVGLGQLQALADALLVEPGELRIGARSIRAGQGQTAANVHGTMWAGLARSLTQEAWELWRSLVVGTSAPDRVIDELLGAVPGVFLVLSLPVSTLDEKYR